MAAGAVSLRKSHDIITLSFCNIVKGQAKTHKSCVFFQKVFSGFSRCESILKKHQRPKAFSPMVHYFTGYPSDLVNPFLFG